MWRLLFARSGFAICSQKSPALCNDFAPTRARVRARCKDVIKSRLMSLLHYGDILALRSHVPSRLGSMSVPFRLLWLTFLKAESENVRHLTSLFQGYAVELFDISPGFPGSSHCPC